MGTVGQGTGNVVVSIAAEVALAISVSFQGLREQEARITLGEGEDVLRRFHSPVRDGERLGGSLIVEAADSPRELTIHVQYDGVPGIPSLVVLNTINDGVGEAHFTSDYYSPGEPENQYALATVVVSHAPIAKAS